MSGSIITFISLPWIERLTLIRSSIATCAVAEPMVSMPALVQFAWTMFKELFLLSFLLCWQTRMKWFTIPQFEKNFPVAGWTFKAWMHECPQPLHQ
jgi:hypothetical protein